jgi:hypothetical protein
MIIDFSLGFAFGFEFFKVLLEFLEERFGNQDDINEEGYEVNINKSPNEFS